jgi:hypothetical protein
MKPVSLWVTLGMSLFLTLNTEAVILGNLPDVTYPDKSRAAIVITPDPEPRPDHHVARQPKPGTPTISMPSIPSGNIHGTLQFPPPSLGASPEPEVDSVSQDPLKPAIINLQFGSGDGDPRDDELHGF